MRPIYSYTDSLKKSEDFFPYYISLYSSLQLPIYRLRSDREKFDLFIDFYGTEDKLSSILFDRLLFKCSFFVQRECQQPRMYDFTNDDEKNRASRVFFPSLIMPDSIS